MRAGALLLVSAAMAAAGVAVAADTAQQVARGRYLVESVGMCGDCHTPRGAMGQPDLQKNLHGAAIDFRPTMAVPVWAEQAPMLAGRPGGWTRAQLVKFLESGERPDGSEARPPMPRVRLRHEDALAVAAYLDSLATPKR